MAPSVKIVMTAAIVLYQYNKAYKTTTGKHDKHTNIVVSCQLAIVEMVQTYLWCALIAYILENWLAVKASIMHYQLHS